MQGSSQLNIFVTGASGFIGSHLVRKLKASGQNVFAYEGDILDSGALSAAIAATNWDVCVHLAAISAYDQCESDPARAFQVNLAGTAHLAEVIGKCKKHRPPHLIFASTAQVYSVKSGIDKLILDEASELGPVSIYGKSKLLAENTLKSLFDLNGGRFTILRLFNHTHKSQANSFYLPYIYSQLFNSRLAKVRIPVGNIDLYRDLGSIFDLARAFEMVIAWGESQSDYYFEVFNVCTGQARKLRDVSDELGRRLERAIEYDTDMSRIRSGDAASICGDNTRIRQVIGWRPTIETTTQLVGDFLKDS